MIFLQDPFTVSGFVDMNAPERGVSIEIRFTKLKPIDDYTYRFFNVETVDSNFKEKIELARSMEQNTLLENTEIILESVKASVMLGIEEIAKLNIQDVIYGPISDRVNGTANAHGSNYTHHQEAMNGSRRYMYAERNRNANDSWHNETPNPEAFNELMQNNPYFAADMRRWNVAQCYCTLNNGDVPFKEENDALLKNESTSTSEEPFTRNTMQKMYNIDFACAISLSWFWVTRIRHP